MNINIGFDYNVFHYYIKGKNLHGKINVQEIMLTHSK